MRQRITQKVISKITSPPKGNRIQYDGEIPGFGVRVTSSGVISFVLNYHIHGLERRFTLVIPKGRRFYSVLLSTCPPTPLG